MPKNIKKWTNEEVELLKNEWPNKSARKELAEKLGRSIPALNIKYQSIELQEARSPKKQRSKKIKGPKISPKFSSSRENSVAEVAATTPEIVEDIQQHKNIELQTINSDVSVRLKELIDLYFKEKKNTVIDDTSALMLEGALIKGMKQMLLLVHTAGYFSSSDIEKLTSNLAKYEKKLMWEALKEHFVSNQDED